MTDFILQHGFGLSIGIALLGLATAAVLFLYIRSIPAGTEKMKEVAAAIEEGAKAAGREFIGTLTRYPDVNPSALLKESGLDIDLQRRILEKYEKYYKRMGKGKTD